MRIRKKLPVWYTHAAKLNAAFRFGASNRDTLSRDMRSVAAVSLLLCANAAAAPVRSASAEEVFQLVSTALATYYADRDLADELDKTALTDRLPADAIAVLRREGIGPSTLSSLESLRERSASLPAPSAALVDLSIPSVTDQRDIFHRIDTFARGYVKSLPNFFCVSATRFVESGKRTDRNAGAVDKHAAWKHPQIITEEVRYVDGADSYKTTLVNGKPDGRPMAEIRTAYTRGDFGSMLTITIDPASGAHFFWDHWELLHGQRVAVYRYSVDQERSQYRVCCTSAGNVTRNGFVLTENRRTAWMSAYRGYLYAMAESGAVVRQTVENVDIPTTSDLSEGRHLFEYSRVNLNGTDYWLPTHAVHYIRDAGYRWESEIEFSKYHKFGADTSITFPTN